MASNLIKILKDKVAVLMENQDCAYDQYSNGVYIFGFCVEKRKAAVVRFSTPADLTHAVESILAVCNPSKGMNIANFKIIGNANLLLKTRNEIQSKGYKVAAEAPVDEMGTKIYFQAENSKIRIEANKREIKLQTTPPIEKDPKRIRKVLIVDDSGTMRKLLRQTIEAEPLLQVVAETGRPTEAEALVAQYKPDVITLDIHMPEMDGITLLKKLCAKFTIPIVMVSTVSAEEGVNVLKALEIGAVDYIEKPRFDEMDKMASVIRSKVLQASDIVIKRVKVENIKQSTGKLVTDVPIVIGSSTGGTEALRVLLTALPAEIPPILIVQHIPAVFSAAFAKRLNELCPFTVKEAEDGDSVKPQQVLIAPGGFHMTVRGTRACTIQIADSPPGYTHKPAVDVLFDSAVKSFGGNCTAIILTGMGKDGAIGMKKLRDVGALTIGQNKESCVVYGMPRAAAEIGAVQKELPLSAIPDYLCKSHGQSRKAA